VRYLLDTSALLHFLGGSPRLSAAARRLMTDPGTTLVISAVSALEVAIKVNIGKAWLGLPVDAFFDQAVRVTGADVLPVTIPHAAAVARLPVEHRDPFDRLLAAQALTEGLPIISPDRAFDLLGVPRSW
jgi:PIN domain nuclease of toxin-antitoxin system